MERVRIEGERITLRPLRLDELDASIATREAADRMRTGRYTERPLAGQALGMIFSKHSTRTASKRRMMPARTLDVGCGINKYPGAIGIKPGYTGAAGQCLLFEATRHGHTVIGVTLHSPGSISSVNPADAIRILNWAFNHLS